MDTLMDTPMGATRPVKSTHRENSVSSEGAVVTQP